MQTLFHEAGNRILRSIMDYKDSRKRSRLYDGIISINDVQSGDVIKVDRGLYDHYGIFVRTFSQNRTQELHAIHYTGRNGHSDFNGIVRETPLDDFLQGAQKFIVCKFYGSKCTAKYLVADFQTALTSQFTATDYTADQEGTRTVERARSCIGNEHYSLPMNNCEHFAVWCRTGESESSQVLDVLHALIIPSH